MKELEKMIGRIMYPDEENNYNILNEKYKVLSNDFNHLNDLYNQSLKDYDEAITRIDKAIEYNEHLIKDAKYHLNLGHLKKMRKILKGDSNE